jgi:hypothetical protein
VRTLLVLLVQLGRMSQPKVAAGLAVVVCASQVHSDDDALMKPARVGRGQHLWRVQRASVCELEQTGQREGGAVGSAYRHLGAARAVMRCSKAFFQPFRRLQDFSCEGRATQKRVARTHSLSSETTGFFAVVGGIWYRLAAAHLRRPPTQRMRMGREAAHVCCCSSNNGSEVGSWFWWWQ